MAINSQEALEYAIYGANRMSWAERNLPPRYQQASLDKAGDSEAARICRRYVEQFTAETDRGLYIFGPTGRGKTWLAAAIGIALVAKSQQFWPAWLEAHEMARRLRDEITNPERGASKPTRDKLRRRGLLIIDDLGSERLTDFVAEELEAAICWRYDYCQPTIFTSNLSLADLDQRMGARVSSRIAEMCQVVQLGGEDRRIG